MPPSSAQIPVLITDRLPLELEPQVAVEPLRRVLLYDIRESVTAPRLGTTTGRLGSARKSRPRRYSARLMAFVVPRRCERVHSSAMPHVQGVPPGHVACSR